VSDGGVEDALAEGGGRVLTVGDELGKNDIDTDSYAELIRRGGVF